MKLCRMLCYGATCATGYGCHMKLCCMLCYGATCAIWRAMAAAMKRCPTHARLAHFLVSNPNIETAGFKTILCSLIPKDHSMLNFAQTVIRIMFLPSCPMDGTVILCSKYVQVNVKLCPPWCQRSNKGCHKTVQGSTHLSNTCDERVTRLHRECRRIRHLSCHPS